MSDDRDLSLIERAVGRMGTRPKAVTQPETTAAPPPPVIEREAAQSTQAPSEPPPSPADPSPPPPAANGRSESPVFPFDLQRLKAEGCITPDTGRSRLAEEYRMIKRPILINAFGKGAALVPDGNMIMVTSTYPGEGKTFTAVNLAMSITQEMDKTVLLVDADVGRSRIHRMLGTPDSPGLMDVLLDDNLDMADAMVRTSISNLRVLPKGRAHPRATELLASNAMAELTREMANRYPDRIVIFDSPPLLITSEAVVLASHMGQIVFVVEANQTSQGAVKEALALLDDSKPIGLVLNKARRIMTSDYYGYGSYSSYHPVADEVK